MRGQLLDQAAPPANPDDDVFVRFMQRRLGQPQHFVPLKERVHVVDGRPGIVRISRGSQH